MPAGIENGVFHVELLSPKQSADDLEADLARFAERYRRILDAGHAVCIPDNPMGTLAFHATELIRELALPAGNGRISAHINTFHTRKNLDEILAMAIDLGIDNLLTISGDGSPRLPRLSGGDLGENVHSVTAVELLKHVRRACPGRFSIGVAFNPYEPQDDELEKMRMKVDAGADFITTQPVLGEHPAVEALQGFGLPIVMGCWMSKRLYLLSECVGYEIPQDAVYDGLENLRALTGRYPGCGFYLTMLGFKTQFPQLGEVWPRDEEGEA